MAEPPVVLCPYHQPKPGAGTGLPRSCLYCERNARLTASGSRPYTPGGGVVEPPYIPPYLDPHKLQHESDWHDQQARLRPPRVSPWRRFARALRGGRD